MNDETIKCIEEINEQIWQCACCDCVKLVQKDIQFKPEPYSTYDPDFDYKIVYVGLNPGWNDRPEWINIYKQASYNDYKEIYKRAWNTMDKILAFHIHLSDWLNIINECLDLYKNINLSPKNFENYIFRAQMSYCNSNYSDKRVISISGKKENYSKKFKDKYCKNWNVITEEVPKCLEKEYLKRIINCIDPAVILFLGKPSYNYLTSNNRSELNNLFGKTIKIPEYKFPLINKRNTSIYGYKVSESSKKIIFLPHPSQRVRNDLAEIRKKGLQNLCSHL